MTNVSLPLLAVITFLEAVSKALMRLLTYVDKYVMLQNSVV